MNFFTRIFPKKTKTLREFITLVESKKIKSISITPLMDTGFNAILVHKASPDKGRPIIYHEIVTRRGGGLATTVAFALAPNAMRKESIRLCLVGEQRIKALQKKLPDTDICLIFEGIAMTSFEDLHQKARAEGIF